MNALHFWLVAMEFVQKQNLYDVLTLKHLKHQLVRIIILRHVIDKMPGLTKTPRGSSSGPAAGRLRVRQISPNCGA